VRVVSLELAKELKDAGLEWEPKFGDFFYMRLGDGTLKTREIEVYEKGDRAPFPEEDVFLPRLDQLLDEIEKRGHKVDSVSIRKSDRYKYDCILYRWVDDDSIGGGYWAKERMPQALGLFEATIREEAAAKALLWILKEERA